MAAVNPLHHPPFVGMIYRAATGETVMSAFSIPRAAPVGPPVMGLATAASTAFGKLRVAQAATNRAGPAAAARPHHA